MAVSQECQQVPIIVHQVKKILSVDTKANLKILGGGGGWFSNFFPGGFGGGGAPGNTGRQPPPPGFRTDYTYDGAGRVTIFN